VCDCRQGQRCSSPAKHPKVTKWQERATSDPQQITKWWKRNEGQSANIGIATGSASNLIVIDIDNGHERSGDDSFSALCAEHRWVPDTYVVRTGRGRHLYFLCPEWNVRGGVDLLGIGVDVRAEGQYVIAAGSLHASGVRYQAQAANAVLETLPDFLRSRLERSDGLAVRQRPEHAAAIHDDALILEGSRNEALFRRACSLRGRGADQQQIVDELQNYNHSCCPPLGAAELTQIARSACRYEKGTSLKEASIHWFKRNVAEWTTNPVIQSLTDFQTGWYVNLEMAAFMGMGFLPDDDDLLWRTARARTKAHFIKHKELVLTEYERVEMDGRPMLFFPRMADCYTEAGLKTRQAREAGLASAEKRRLEAMKTNAA